MAETNWTELHKNNQSWRTKLIGELSSAFVIPRYGELLEKYFKKGPKKRFLELGSGNGEVAEMLRKKNYSFIDEYVVSENFDEGVQWLREKGFKTERVDAQRINLADASFDTVLCFDVMHHVADPVAMGREMMRVARGQLFLTEANGWSLGRKIMECTPGHRKAGERSYTPAQYRAFFNQPGFRLTRFEIHPFIFPLHLPKKFIPKLVRFNRWIEKVPFLKWQCSNVYLYIEYERT